MKASEAFRFALNRALAVFWGGMVAAGLYLTIVLIGPGLEGRLFPVFTHFHLTGFKQEAGGAVSWRPRFYKVRDCINYGSAWFAIDDSGNMTRVQLNSLSQTPVPPTTGPIGWRWGEPQIINPPEGSIAVMAVAEHDCGLVWHTRTYIGPFSLRDGQPMPSAAR